MCSEELAAGIVYLTQHFAFLAIDIFIILTKSFSLEIQAKKKVSNESRREQGPLCWRMEDFPFCSALRNEGNTLSKPGLTSVPWDGNTTCWTEWGTIPGRRVRAGLFTPGLRKSCSVSAGKGGAGWNPRAGSGS